MSKMRDRDTDWRKRHRPRYRRSRPFFGAGASWDNLASSSATSANHADIHLAVSRRWGHDDARAGEHPEDEQLQHMGSRHRCDLGRLPVLRLADEAGGQLCIMSDGTTYYRGGDVYMAKAPGDFKVYEISAVTDGGSSISFAAGHEGVPGVTFTLPNNLLRPVPRPYGGDRAARRFVVRWCPGICERFSRVGTRRAVLMTDPSFQMSCSQIDVTNGGSGSPGPLVAIPGSHTGYEPDILINLDYPVPKNYTQPGPAAAEDLPKPAHPAPERTKFTEPRQAATLNDLRWKRGDFGSCVLWSRPIYEYAVRSGCAERIFSPEDARSAELWYSNGKVIVKVEGMYFKLFHSRLERHCEYSKHMFEDGEATVFDVQDIMLQDFEKLLNYLEISGAQVSLDLRCIVVIGNQRAKKSS
ncbi:hypothetical protein C8T65DRAFT_702880 [Cerioporus squamosus]|nr:hypothetical protein C8T65DRAFT_702880 [Cerioporus squamosus]